MDPSPAEPHVEALLPAQSRKATASLLVVALFYCTALVAVYAL